jgi:hypothetical protein
MYVLGSETILDVQLLSLCCLWMHLALNATSSFCPSEKHQVIPGQTVQPASTVWLSPLLMHGYCCYMTKCIYNSHYVWKVFVHLNVNISSCCLPIIHQNNKILISCAQLKCRGDLLGFVIIIFHSLPPPPGNYRSFKHSSRSLNKILTAL